MHACVRAYIHLVFHFHGSSAHHSLVACLSSPSCTPWMPPSFPPSLLLSHSACRSVDLPSFYPAVWSKYLRVTFRQGDRRALA
eukprot:6194854-Pleurochrysis_carterae.AAC.2